MRHLLKIGNGNNQWSRPFPTKAQLAQTGLRAVALTTAEKGKQYFDKIVAARAAARQQAEASGGRHPPRRRMPGR